MELSAPAAPSSTTARWYVYQCHPQAERSATHELTRSGYRVYLPLIAIRRRDPVIPSLFHRVLVPRFRGYGFAELGPTEPWVPICDSPGVSGILRGADGRPAPLRSGEIELHMADDVRLCDLTAVRELAGPPFAAGAVVRIEGGALAGFLASVIECDGIVTACEVEIFGRLVPTHFPRGDLAAV